MLMKKSLGEDHPIDAFSYISDDPILSEERYVEAACNAAKVNLHSVTPTPEEFASDLNNLINCQEFPFGGPSVYAQYRVFRMAKENGIKVMLDGQGSDELMAGYYFFIGAKITSLLCSLSVLKALSVIRGVPKNMANHFFRMLMFSFGRVLPNAMRSFFRSLVAEPLFPHWLQQSWFLANGVCGDERKSGQGRNALKQEMAIAVQQGGLAELLRYEDRNSMWFSIESRVPFCNHHLAGLTFSLPADRLISTKGVTKAVLKDSMRGIVPDMIIDRDKIGFATPERNWLSAMRPLIVEIMTDAETIKLPFFTAAREEVLLAIEGSGRWPTHVWRIINYILWSKQVGVEY
jgi:asparagine synthase (glutamine-hydrolysing)